jgi:hypothetical protein
VREGDCGRFVFLLNHGQEEVEIRLPEPMTEALSPGETLAANTKGGADRPSPLRRHLPPGMTAFRKASCTSLGRSSPKVSSPMTEMPL